MSTTRQRAAGATRTCPHCRATILESAAICPACRHHLRFVAGEAAAPEEAAASPLRVEGTIRHPAVGEAWEYSVLLAVRDGRGNEVSRQVVGVGALNPGDERTFSLAVEVVRGSERK